MKYFLAKSWNMLQAEEKYCTFPNFLKINYITYSRHWSPSIVAQKIKFDDVFSVFRNRSMPWNGLGCECHSLKSVRIRRFSGPSFPVFGLNTERYFVFLYIQSAYGKMWTIKTPNMDTFYGVCSVQDTPQNMKFCFLINI